MKVLSSVAIATFLLGGVVCSRAQLYSKLVTHSPNRGLESVLSGSRLSEIASQLKDPKVDGVPLLTEALRQCGFAIWTDDRKKLMDPLDGMNLNLAITDTEIQGYLQMYRRGDRILLSDLAAMFEPIYRELGGTKSVLEHLTSLYQGSMFSTKAELRNLSQFLFDMGTTHDEAKDAPITLESKLDPVQALILTRIVSEELRVLLKKTRKSAVLQASIRPIPVQDGPPGWAGDAFAGGITGLVSELIEKVAGKEVSEGVGKANALMSIAKFIMTYNFLKGEVKVEEPGQPLIRTKDKSAGEKRTVVAKFYIDGTAATDWIKANRAYFNTIGFDPDVPKSEPMKGVEVEWDIKQSTKHASKQLIQAVTGTGALNKQKTNDKGESRVTFEGKPQTQTINPRTAMPVEKEVPMEISPQVKSVEMQQDLVDAVMGAIGLKDGPSGLVGPIMEMLYRAKWTCPAPFTLKVRDWIDGEVIGQFTADVNGEGRYYSRDASYVARINRKLVFTDYGMASLGGFDIPQIDPNLLKNLPETQRKQMEEGMKQAMAMSKKRTFMAEKPGSVLYTVSDSLFQDVDTSDCEQSRNKSQSSWTVSYSGEAGSPGVDTFRFTVDADLEKKIAKVSVIAVGKGRYVRVALSKDVKPANTETSVTLLDRITVQKSGKSDEFEIPLKETPLRDQQGSNFYGAATFPFKFGPENKFSGSIIMSYSVTRKNPPKK